MERAPGRILLLHGASSAGKSTLARAVQAVAPRPFLHLSFDTIRDTGALPWARFRSGDFDWAAHRDAVFDGLHSAMTAFARAGCDLIVEHILSDDPRWAADLDRLWEGLDVFRVGVMTPLEALVAREAGRGDRRVGSAAEDFAVVHRGMVYDMTVDGTADPQTSAGAILAAWEARGLS